MLERNDRAPRHDAGGELSVSKPVTERELVAVTAFARCCDLFLAIRSTMPMQYVRAFYLVASDEGLGVGEYARRAGVSISVMSRHLLDIGERNRYMEPGFGLVSFRPDPMNYSKHQIFLTDKGRELAHRIDQIIRKVK